MISFEESIHLVAGLAKPLAAEDVALDGADGRVLATPVVSSRDAPAFAVSATDGYALRDDDLRGLPIKLEVVGKTYAGGRVLKVIQPGTCMRVFTGAAVPEGADRVVMQEDVIAEGISAVFSKAPGNSRHIRAAGSDFIRGDVLVPARVPLNPQRLVAVAAADLARVSVIRQPRVCIIGCGDELVAPGSGDLETFHIPDSLSIALAAMVRRWNGIVVGTRIYPDDIVVLRQAATDAVAHADVVVVTGGASVGEKDYAKAMFYGCGLEMIFAKVAIRPGKPVWLGNVGNTIVLGLPGNPTSALVTARLYLAPLLAGLAGFDPAIAWNWRPMPLGAPLEASGDRHTFLRAKACGAGVAGLRDQDSSAQKTLADAEYLIDRPPGVARAETGASVSVLPF